MSRTAIFNFSLLLTLLLSGCSDSSNSSPSGNAGATARGLAAAGSTPTNQPNTEAQFAAITNQFAVAQQTQNELIQKLLTRIEQLEAKDTEHVASVQTANAAREEQLKAHQEQSGKLLQEITALQGKVNELQAGRVLPEITLTPDDSPTTRELDQKIRIAELEGSAALVQVADRWTLLQAFWFFAARN